MTTISTTDVVNGQVTDASIVNNNFSAVKNTVNGSIDNSNVAAGAAIAVSKLAPGADGQVLTTTGGQAQWGALAAGAVPAGLLAPYGGAAAPTGWLLCDGATVSRATFAALFTAIGTAYGAGDGSTTFALPDMRGRMAVGKGSHTSVDTLGENDGVAEANRRPQHRHTPHTHTVGSSASFPAGSFDSIQSPASGTHFTTNSQDGGSGNANDSLDAPAYLVMNFIIKT